MKEVILLISLLWSITAFAKKLVVGKGQHYTSISRAFTESKNGDTILVKKGIYNITGLVINKSITLIGEDYPELNGGSKYEILTIIGQKIKVQGFSFVNSGYSSVNDFAAIKLINSNNVTICNNRLSQTYFGIHVSNSDYFTISNNTLFGKTRTEQTSGNGIHLWKCDHALIEDNNVTGHRDGIYFEFVTNSMIRNNVSQSNIRYGLHFMFSHNNTYANNQFRKNGSGVAIMYSHQVIMLNNVFEQNWGAASYGILLKEISDSRIEHNTFYKNTIGLHLEGTTRIMIRYNTFKENGWAAKVQASCSDNDFNHNNFLSNTFDIGTNGTLVLNHFDENYWDKYEGYDLNKDGKGDVPYHPVSMYSMVIEQNPNSVILLRSFMVTLLDKVEKAAPALTPENLVDIKPLMNPIRL